ncbi:hypothetical protein EDC04DRAFT_2688871 [Pisolithus marmoratus]|nr:hypothetical protein EDC04DRAFT_2688871 [Pisolithus marmoratus]
MDPSISSADCLLALSASEASDTDEQQGQCKSDASDTPLRRSPRFSPAASPHSQSPGGYVRGDVENSPGGCREDLSWLSREDPLLQDEPSSVLASKIMRAFDNPSPPPQRRVHTCTEYTPGKDGRFPSLDTPAPPSPFRAVNLLERLNQLAEPLAGATFPSPRRPSPLNCADSVIEPHSPSTINVQTAPAGCSTQGSSLTRTLAHEVSYITGEFPGVSGQQKVGEDGAVIMPGACASQPSSSTNALDLVGEGSVNKDIVIVMNPRSGSKRKLVAGDLLRSLSPQSEGLLTQILPSSPQQQEASLKSSLSRDGVHRTPARRVPIYDALVNATPSLQKAARHVLLESQSRHIPNAGGSVFSRPGSLPRSPAKRVPVAGCTPSPIASVEPQPIVPPSVRSRSVEPSPVSTSTRGNGTRENLVRQYPIPEENEAAEAAAPDATTRVSPLSPDKSHLRQRSVASRIPRMNAKPYARPQTSANNSVSKKPISLTRPCSEGGHGSAHELTDQNINGFLPPFEAGTSQPSFRSTSVRQVMPGTLRWQACCEASKFIPRSLADWHQVPRNLTPRCCFAKLPMACSQHTTHLRKQAVETGETSLPGPAPVPSRQDTDSSAPRLAPEAQASGLFPVTASTKQEGHSSITLSPYASDVALKENDLNSQSSERKATLKRSSRTRKAASHVDDMFGNTPRSVQANRRPPTRGEASSFTGMSATALRALTSSNTARNQKTVAILATEVIKKEGPRPESPAVKIRTILQKEKEQKDRQRKERAQRRARRSEEGSVGSDTEGLSEHTVHTPDDHGHDENVDLTPTRHVRAPGDEEDYETPERLSPIKKPRFDEEDEGEQAKPTKQVKWRRGLATTAYVDDVHPKPRFQRLDPHAKGCLAPSSKGLRLDTLGNIMDIDSRPPLQLVQEHVVVKKYMYDSDVEAEPAPMRMTRSKNKKPKG